MIKYAHLIAMAKYLLKQKLIDERMFNQLINKASKLAH